MPTLIWKTLIRAVVPWSERIEADPDTRSDQTGSLSDKPKPHVQGFDRFKPMFITLPTL